MCATLCAGSDVLCAALYIRGCGWRALIAGGAGGDALPEQKQLKYQKSLFMGGRRRR